MNTVQQPATLVEAIRYYADQEVCFKLLTSIRWPDGVICPRCASKNVHLLTTRQIWKCREKTCHKQFSIKVGTIFEDSPIKLDKWFCAIWMIVSAKNGVSSYEIHRSLGVMQKTAWFMMHRIRLALQRGSLDKLKREVEADETFIGGKARNMHFDKRQEKIKGGGPTGKAIVMGLLERHGKVRAQVVETRTGKDLKSMIRENVERGSEVFTDQLKSYVGVDRNYVHRVINHAEQYVQGRIHTNSIENFWSLLKRGLSGTYISVEPFHLFRYLDEQSFRFNARKGTDAERFLTAVSTIGGRRLTYQHLIGHAGSC